MSNTVATDLLRSGLLEGLRIAVVGARAPAARGGGAAKLEDRGIAGAVHDACVALGARVSSCELSGEAADELDDEAIDGIFDGMLEQLGGLELLAVDGAGLFAHARGTRGSDARAALASCLDVSWSVTRAVATRAFIAQQSGGRIVYVAPAEPAAARAGLENLARTLSIEWARYGISAVAIAPGAGTTEGELAALTAYLASPAGAYFSGCLMDLRGAGAR